MLVDGDGAIGRKADACCFEVKAFGVRFAACCHQHVVGLHAHLLAFLLKEDGRAVDALHACSHVEGDATLLHQFAQALGYVAVQHGQALLQVLHHGYFRTEPLEHARKLHADDAGTNDAEPLGQFLEGEQFGGGHYLRTVCSGNGQHLCAAARGDDDVLCRNAIHGLRIGKDTFLTNQSDVWV